MQDGSARYRLFFEGMNELAAVEQLLYDANGEPYDWRYIDVNPAFEATFGVSREQTVGRTAREILGLSELPQQYLEVFARVARTGKPERFEVFHESLGKYYLHSVFPVGDDVIATISTDVTEDRLAQIALQRYRLLSENARDIILYIRQDGSIMEANQAATEIYGYTIDELLSLNIRDLRAEDVLPSLEEQLRQAGERGILFETYHRKKDGSVFPVEVSSRGFGLAGERVMLSIVRDITDRKQTEAKLLASEEKFSKAFQAGPQIMTISSLDDDRYIDVNDSFCEIIGYKHEEAVGKSAEELGIWVNYEQRRKFIRALRQGKTVRNAEVQYRTRSGRIITALLSAEMVEIEGRPCLLAISNDITQRKEAREALDKERRRLRAVLDSLPVGVFIADARGKIVGLNDQVQRIWGSGAPLAERVEDYAAYRGWWAETGEPISAYEWALARAITKGETSLGELINIERFDGARATILNSAAPIKDAADRIIGAVATVQDVTEMQDLRQRLERALSDANRERDRIVALQSISDAGIVNLELRDLLDALAQRVAKGLSAHSCTFLLRDEKTGDFVVSSEHKSSIPRGYRIKSGDGFVGMINSERRTVYIADASADPTVRSHYFEQAGVKSLLGTPLIVRGKIIGAVYVDMLEVRKYDEDEIRLFEAMAARAALAIDNAVLYEALTRSQAELRNALNSEREYSLLLQRALLPRAPQVPRGYDVAVHYAPAVANAEIGGDFYDVFESAEDMFSILIGDVSGKGLEAASMAATTRSTIHAYAHESTSAADVLTRANAVLSADHADFSSFVTVFFAILDTESGNIVYSTGGHPPGAVRRSDGTVEFLQIGPPPLGFLETHEYTQNKARLNYGDKLILYTDGISEARRNSVLFDIEGIQRTLEDYGHLPASDIADMLLDEARKWAEGRLTDDAAIVVIERL